MPGQVFVSVHCWNGSCSFLPASSSSFKMLPRFIHCPDDRGLLAILAILWITTITCEIDMEWIWNAITGKTFVLIFANRKKDIYKLLFKKKKIIISFYSILFLNPNWPFVLCWFYDPVFTKWLSAFPLF